MRHVELEALIPAEQATTVFDSVRRWERYPDLAPHVKQTTVHATYPAEDASSSWELHFRSGLLRWTEDDVFVPERGEIRFEQSDGDFDSFTGTWTLTQQGDDVAVRFDADFDFGIPSLEGILDPIAERVIKETVAWALTGLFPAVRLSGGVELTEPAAVGV
ncbi:cyclase [Streptomyces avermitilis]|uniref:Cyclase/dehydrase n=2 Tax=Streptomyces avermitilis TaxID=33903 RepID=Q82KT6_STRAW|nr:SRPBCC family protein [Streptomyces avermitilis]MYS97896.1 cyclase [Streptomyces sp. SID5469]KUN50949.1 cyclase [Streptomyces avermitilis]OOV24287.1 cyclase [Streptomyces avermitilis]BAC69997.1 putative cyclase/dehydrase [Streptomyces avermitilis MA-4680 = NBRC 14893]BBJ50058.1 cyclase [Streptomyces avermitilis]